MTPASTTRCLFLFACLGTLLLLVSHAAAEASYDPTQSPSLVGRSTRHRRVTKQDSSIKGSPSVDPAKLLPTIVVTEEAPGAEASPSPVVLQATKAAASPPLAVEAAPEGGTNDTSSSSNATTIAQKIDEALEKEFGEDAKQISADTGKTFNETVKKDEAVLETVVRISGSKSKASEEAATSTSSSSIGNITTSSGSSSSSSGSGDGSSKPETSMMAAAASAATLPKLESSVDRIIDSHDNEYVLSSSRDAAATLTLDPQFVQDLTFILTTAAIMGMVFEALQQPVINGYLVAGAILGPGGLALIKELVQVESLAQLGVQLLLFGLGRELSVSRFKAVWGVSLIGGSLQLLALMLLGGVLAALLTSNVPQGVFIGCLLSMSSTSVVVKCLEVTKATGSAYGQITIGTLILQDCSVGLLFALMPAFAPAASTVMGGAGGAGRAMAAAMEGGMDAGVTAAEGSSSSDAAVLAVLMLIIGVVLKLVVMLVVAVVLARTLLPFALQLMMKHCSSELVQLSLVGICLSCAWLSGHLRLSEELGAFISGAMISMAERALILKGSPLSPIHRGSSCGGGPNEAGYAPGPAGAAVAYAAVATSGPAAAAAQAVQPLEGPHGHHSGLTGNIDSIINVLTALFVASVGLIMSPVFLWHHLWVLLAGTLVVMVVKAFVVAAVVHMFGTPVATSCAVGLTMAHIGEFSFVLLSMASQLKLLSPQLYMLLLGVTAMSLLTTPPIIMLAGRLLQQEAHGAGCNPCGGWGSRRLQQQRSGLPVANGNGSSSGSSEKAPLRGGHR